MREDVKHGVRFQEKYSSEKRAKIRSFEIEIELIFRRFLITPPRKETLKKGTDLGLFDKARGVSRRVL